MNELLKEFKFDIDRFILQIFIPGLFAMLPFFILAIDSNEAIKSYFSKSETTMGLLALFISLAIGIIIGSIGSWIELKIYNCILKTMCNINKNEWDIYLEVEIPGNSNLVILKQYKRDLERLRFQVIFMVSILIMTFGLYVLQCNNHYMKTIESFVLCCLILPLLILCYLYFEVKTRIKTLIEYRRLIINHFPPIIAPEYDYPEEIV